MQNRSDLEPPPHPAPAESECERPVRAKSHGAARLPAIDNLTEDAAARVFTAEYRGKLLFDHDAGRWLEWSGSHWKPCRTPRAFHYARQLIRRLATDPRAKTPGRAAFAAAVERFAQADPAHARHSGTSIAIRGFSRRPAERSTSGPGSCAPLIPPT